MAASRSPAVSVVVPTHKPRYLEETLASIRSQTFRDLEVILIDDDAGRGTAASRNAGLSRARGRFVAFLDHDDLWYPGFLAEMVARLRSPKIMMAASNVDLIDGRGRVLLKKAVGASGKADKALRAVSGLSHTPCMSACVFRKSALEAVGGLDERFLMLDDLDLFQRLAKKYGPRAIVFVDRALGAYRRHAAQQTAVYGRFLGNSAGLARAFLKGKKTTPAQRGVLLDMAYFFTKHAPAA